MEAFKDFFHLDVILRQCLGGVAFFALLLGRHHEVLHGKIKINATILVTALIITFLVGSFLHVLQRALFGLFIDKLRGGLLRSHALTKNIFHPTAVKANVFRLQLNRETAKVCSELRTWGSSIHSLYTVAFAIVCAQSCEPFYLPEAPRTIWSWVLWPDWTIWSGVFAIFLLGFLNDCRKFILEKAIKDSRRNSDWSWNEAPRHGFPQ